ncbi:Hypp753 [Branchiostoma lanceolatum]|uniref:Hypp753 protein n=1 Tax=Branchiostoma lanceolatum TaxID=7740 RepID=A0A8J9YK96_BRALA|nr:Hypp753 [Branchiostoma lanceolatum]
MADPYAYPAPVFAQPLPPPPVYPSAPGTEPGPLMVRNLEAHDVDFVSRMMVEAFNDKFEHAVGKSRMEGAVQQSARMLGRSRQVWHRYFIALYEGRPAGAMAIRFHGDSAEEDFQCGEACSYLGCWGTRGLICLGCATGSESVPMGECYVDHIGVDASFRGRGIGKMLMDRADCEARQRGCRTIFLWVKQSNRAVHLYERQGYSISETVNGSCLLQCALGSADFYKMQKPL